MTKKTILSVNKLNKQFRSRLELTSTGRYVTAKVVHFEAGPVLQASTNEWAIKKQLFKTNDTSAYINLARVSSANICLKKLKTE